MFAVKTFADEQGISFQSLTNLSMFREGPPQLCLVLNYLQTVHFKQHSKTTKKEGTN